MLLLILLIYIQFWVSLHLFLCWKKMLWFVWSKFKNKFKFVVTKIFEFSDFFWLGNRKIKANNFYSIWDFIIIIYLKFFLYRIVQSKTHFLYIKWIDENNFILRNFVSVKEKHIFFFHKKDETYSFFLLYTKKIVTFSI